MAFRNLFSRKRGAEHPPVGKYARLARDLEPLIDIMRRLTSPSLKPDQIDDEDVKEAVNTIRFLNERLLDLSRELYQLKSENEQLKHRLQGIHVPTQALGINRNHKQRIQRDQVHNSPVGQGPGQIQWSQTSKEQEPAAVRSALNASSDDSRDRGRHRSE